MITIRARLGGFFLVISTIGAILHPEGNASHAARNRYQASKTMTDIERERLHAEITEALNNALKLQAEEIKLAAEERKLRAEERKLHREATWWPMMVGASATLAIVAIVAIVKLLLT